MQFRKSFGEAKSLATTLADNDGIKYGVITTDGESYMIASEHTVWFTSAKVFDPETLVAEISPGGNKEDIYKRALEQIAYPENHPQNPPPTDPLRNWMQAVAANALTNGGRRQENG